MYRVTKRFRCKYTGDLYVPGDFFTSEDQDRVSYMVERGFIADQFKPDYDSLTKAQISDILESKGIEHNMRLRKDELIALLGGD